MPAEANKRTTFNIEHAGRTYTLTARARRSGRRGSGLVLSDLNPPDEARKLLEAMELDPAAAEHAVKASWAYKWGAVSTASGLFLGGLGLVLQQRGTGSGLPELLMFLMVISIAAYVPFRYYAGQQEAKAIRTED